MTDAARGSVTPEEHCEWSADGLYRVTLTLCSRCLRGEGGECHTPGCGLWLNRAPDLPLPAENGWPIQAAEYLGSTEEPTP